MRFDCGRMGSPGWSLRWWAAGGRRRDPGRSRVVAAAAHRQCGGQSAGAGLPVAEMLDEIVHPTLEALAKALGSGRPISARSSGSPCSRPWSSRRSSMGGSRRSCSWMICWRDLRWNWRGSMPACRCVLGRLHRRWKRPSRPSSVASVTLDCGAPGPRLEPQISCDPRRHPVHSRGHPEPRKVITKHTDRRMEPRVYQVSLLLYSFFAN